ncbi:hypothetical protein [Vibrio coralliirubri]|uniref:hypothetical protein n=1 Tax=Vibrio coralliirubri TaxID=1516159 RepID=UPI00067EA17E|nr:hypothetical protein [Vibrio coralliirubri]
MALLMLNNSIDSFWYDQDQKLLANPFFIGKFGHGEDEWHFRDKRGSVTKIDFSVFDLPAFKVESTVTFKKDDRTWVLSSKEYAKVLCLILLTPKSLRFLLPAYQMTMHILAFLHERHAVALTATLLDDFWTSFMGRSVDRNGFFNRVSVPSYRGTIQPVSLARLRNQLSALGITGVIEQKFTHKKMEKSLDNVCQSQHSMTLNEFKKGHSFNFLGLEMGQYYVDYLNHIYQTNFIYAAACKKAMSTMLEVIDKANVTESKSRSRLIHSIFVGLSGDSLETEQIITKGLYHQELKAMTEKVLVAEYNQRFEAVCSLRNDNIDSLVLELDLGARFDSVEVIRVLMLQKFYDLKVHKSPEDVWRGYLSSLDKSFIDSQSLNSITVDDVYTKMHLIVSKQKLVGKKCLTSIQAWVAGLMVTSALSTYESLKALLDIQFHAMTTLIVAWTGYRHSEYGFPLSAIRTVPNRDILDNAHVPVRFKLKWLVPKTNRGTKIDREVTSQCYQIAAQLNELFGNRHDEPCLYALTGINTNRVKGYKSECFIERRVKVNWVGFVKNYQPFNEVMRLNDLLQKSCILTSQEQSEIETLSLKYPVDTARYRHLLSSATEVKSDWLRLSNTGFAGAMAQKKFKLSLVAYSQGYPVDNRDHQEIIDKYLSSGTREQLQSGKINLDDKKTMRDINFQILEGVRYPSPHALRHTWAEAVLTRYQGDVGAVIRHQFCHLDGSFFMAYLRGKDARGLILSAKQRYLNSIIEMLIIELEPFDEQHSGGFSRFVQKATQLTQVKTASEIRALREKIAGRVIDIQPSRFAVCIPRDGGESRAKCAKMGSLNPQDAKPEFCLDCINAWITEGNIRGIWQTIQPMVKEAMQPKGIGFLLESHLPALTSSWRRIKELRNARNRDSVDRILAAIEEAVDSIKAKMKVEAERYGYE